MLKRILLVFASLVVITLAFVIYQGMDETPPVSRRPNETISAIEEKLPEFSTPSTQPTKAQSMDEASLRISDFKVPPGHTPRVRVFDEKGNARIIFQATKWDPVSDDTFHMVEPNGRLLLPGGQLAYIRADEGQVKLQKAGSQSYNPKSGWLKGNVRLFIDRTTPEWREAHPDLQSPEQHPETIVKIWLDEVQFDMDLGQLTSKGVVQAQSSIGAVEGVGLKLVWNETDRKIKLLRIDQGKLARIYGAGLAQFGLTATTSNETSREQPSDSEDKAPTSVDEVPESPTPNKPARVDVVDAETDKAKASPSGLTFLDLEDDTTSEVKEDRVDTYRVIFQGDVEAIQRDGALVAGRLKADLLSILRDFSKKDRSAVAHIPDKKEGAKPEKDDSSSTDDDAPPADWSSTFAQGRQDSVVELSWSGTLTIQPDTDEQANQPTGEERQAERLHVVAEGNPVELFDRSRGGGTCRKLEYHDETKQVWLTGTSDQPVSMSAGQDRMLVAEHIFFDPKEGIARVEGPGRMLESGRSQGISDDQVEWPECMTAGLRKDEAADEIEPEDRKVQIGWSRSVEIAFGRAPVGEPDPETGKQKIGEYIKSAVFDGDVSLSDPSFSIAAQHLKATFLPPADDQTDVMKRRSVAADHVLAEGNVRMTHISKGVTDSIACRRLEVEMTVDETGRNVPRIGRAYGDVVAAQGSRSIRADDELIVELASVPKPVTDRERLFLQRGAQRCGYNEESPEWQMVEKKLRDRRELEVTSMNARGQVIVNDPKENLDLAAETLECAFTSGQKITKALIVGTDSAHAHVDLGEFYIKGRQISLNMEEQTAHVPGDGLLSFVTNKDLDGRITDEPIPISIAWLGDMSLDGAKNYSIFRKQVRASSRQSVLQCDDELRIRFMDLPKPPVSGAGRPTGLLSRMIDLTRNDPPQDDSSAMHFSRGLRKRPSYLHAVGNAVILSSSYEIPQAPGSGIVTEALASFLPDELMTSESNQAPDAPGRLMSRVRIAGPQIAIDFVDAYLSVEGRGNLLIEDYRLPDARNRRARAARASELFADASVGDLSSTGMSQTLFRWQNSMTYLSQRNVAVFDHAVEMKHRSGSEMVLTGELQQALNLDGEALQHIKSRRAGMTCENLLVEFERMEQDGTSGATPSPLSGATRLKSLRASQRVHMEESSRSLEGHLVTFNAATGILQISGSPQNPARISEIESRTGDMKLWRGDSLIWNRETGVIEIKGSSLIAPGS